MNYPLISEYIEAIKAAEDNFDLEVGITEANAEKAIAILNKE